MKMPFGMWSPISTHSSLRHDGWRYAPYGAGNLILGTDRKNGVLDRNDFHGWFCCGGIDSNPLAGVLMLERYLTGASTYAQSIDHLFLLIAALVGFWLIVAETALFWLSFKFRRKQGRPTQYVTGEEKHLARWVTIPHLLVILCDIVIIVPALIVWFNIKQTNPPIDQTVRIFG